MLREFIRNVCPSAKVYSNELPLLERVTVILQRTHPFALFPLTPTVCSNFMQVAFIGQ